MTPEQESALLSIVRELAMLIRELAEQVFAGPSDPAGFAAHIAAVEKRIATEFPE